MIRGTTPTMAFDVDADLTTAQVIFVTMTQMGRVVLEKDIEDLEVEERKISMTLSQDDTLALADDIPVMIQIRARFPDGAAIASNIMRADAGRILKEGVI